MKLSGQSKQPKFYPTSPLVGASISRFFSYSVLNELARFGHSPIASRIAHQHELLAAFDSTISVSDFYDELFQVLIHEYRDEYIYKNALAEKILLGKHNLNTAAMLTEFRAHNCKADVVILNGTSHVYEIKSEMDNFDRLGRQIESYKKVFDLITVITTEKQHKMLEERLDESVGIMVLAKDGYRFKKAPYREPVSNAKNVSTSAIFDSLHRTEYLRIIKEQFSIMLDEVPNTQIYDLAKSYFVTLSPEIAHSEMVKIIKSRPAVCRVADYIDHVPSSLKSAYISLKLSKSDNIRFLDTLKEKAVAVFN